MAGERNEALEDREENGLGPREPVKYHSVAECNRRTRYVCALRLRAQYKRQEHVFCKVHLFPHTLKRNWINE